MTTNYLPTPENLNIDISTSYKLAEFIYKCILLGAYPKYNIESEKQYFEAILYDKNPDIDTSQVLSARFNYKIDEFIDILSEQIIDNEKRLMKLIVLPIEVQEGEKFDEIFDRFQLILNVIPTMKNIYYEQQFDFIDFIKIYYLEKNGILK